METLIYLIPEIKKCKNFAVVDINKESIFHLYNNSEIVDNFIKIVYKIPIIISFDWITWIKNNKLFYNLDYDFNSIDIPTKCKILTAIVRSDRFNDGTIVSLFENGTILKIIESIKYQININNTTNHA